MDQRTQSGQRPNKRRITADSEEPSAPESDAVTVLFRNSDTSAKKHTRPPISKLFSSIGLPPEQFLELSADAKNYMLDDSHPERRDTVGVKGNSDSELVKLRLWNCVQDFLEREDHGERFFGRHAQALAQGSSSMVWPQDKAKIVKALLPLLRRVITNEKQRQYALEYRSKVHEQRRINGTAKEEAEKFMLSMASHRLHMTKWGPTEYSVGKLFNSFTSQELASYHHWEECKRSPRIMHFYTESGISEAAFDEIVAVMDHHLRFYHSDPGADFVMCSEACENTVVQRIAGSYPEIWEIGHWGSPIEVNPCDKMSNVRTLLQELFETLRVFTHHGLEYEPSTASPKDLSPNSYYFSVATPSSGAGECGKPGRSPLSLHITVLQGPQDTTLYRREAPAADAPYLHTLQQMICRGLPPHGTSPPRVYVHLPNGLVLIENDSAWADALEASRHTVWFDGSVNVVVRL